MKTHSGNWTELRTAPLTLEVDFHRAGGRDGLSFWQHMEQVERDVRQAIERGHALGLKHVLFVHGWSTSGAFRKSSRSIVRGIFRSKWATPFVLRSESVQHETALLVAIRPNPKASEVSPRCPRCSSAVGAIGTSMAGHYVCGHCRSKRGGNVEVRFSLLDCSAPCVVDVEVCAADLTPRTVDVAVEEPAAHTVR